MAKKIVTRESYSLAPSTMIELFELDMSMIDGVKLPPSQQVLYFYNFKEEKGGRGIYFGDPLRHYMPISIDFKNNAIKGDGSTLPRPRLTIGNPDGIVSYYLRESLGMVGAKFTRNRTFAKFLDGQTWGGTNPFGSHDPDATVTADIYYVDNIVQENKEFVEIECASILEVQGVHLPRARMFATQCNASYRNDSTCSFNAAILAGDVTVRSGVDYTKPVATVDNRKFEEAAPAGWGYTLNDRGTWAVGVSYEVGDFIEIVTNQGTEDDVPHPFKHYFYVCRTAHTSTQNLYPTRSQPAFWLRDACSQRIDGCRCRFPDDKLRMFAYPGLSRAEMENTKS